MPIFAKSSIIDTWLGSKYASDDTERAFPVKQKPFSVPAKKTQHLFLTMQYLQKENEKKLYWCLKNQTEETGTNTPLYFSTFQFSSVISKQVFCSHIHWCIQNPVKHLKWGLSKNSSEKKLFLVNDFRGWGRAEVMNSLKITSH